MTQMNDVSKRFLNLISYDTSSSYDSKTYPSTPSQMNFAKTVLLPECEKIGLTDVIVDEYGYLTATLPSNTDRDIPTVAFIAHMDTSSDASGKNIKPQIIENYDGSEIFFDNALSLSPSMFPDLKNYIGQDLITTDGTTLLGADDKAGIAEILTAMEYLIKNPSIKHGNIKIAFTPDEEVGRGVNHFDVKKFAADFAYTIDGGRVGEFEYESFNAARAVIDIQGTVVHPGSAKGIMINATLTAIEIASRFPADETPATTEGREGFFHLTKMSGNVGEATLEYIIRDFDKNSFINRKEFIKNLADEFGVEHNIWDEYYNMYDVLSKDEHSQIRDIALESMESLGITPIINPIRGGTDGSRLSFMGLPCPNIFTGGHNYHGPYEFIPIQSMIKATEVIVKICELIPQKF